MNLYKGMIYKIAEEKKNDSVKIGAGIGGTLGGTLGGAVGFYRMKNFQDNVNYIKEKAMEGSGWNEHIRKLERQSIRRSTKAGKLYTLGEGLLIGAGLGAGLGAAAGAAHKAWHGAKPIAPVDKIAMYREEIYKQAEDISGKELLKRVKTKNKVPKEGSIWNHEDIPDNYRYNSNVRSGLNVNLKNDGNVRYDITHRGMGRWNQSLEGKQKYIDIPSVYLKDETPDQYNARRYKNVKGSIGAKRIGDIAQIALPIASTVGGAAIGRRVLTRAMGAPPVFSTIWGGTAGLMVGAGVGALAKHIGNKMSQKSYLDKLNPRERMILKEVKDKEMATGPQNFNSSSNRTIRNYYSY